MRKTIKTINFIYYPIVALFILDALTTIDIKAQWLKSLVYYAILLSTPLILVLNIWKLPTHKAKLLWSILPVTLLVSIFYTGPVKFLFARSSWVTQTIQYENSRNSHAIE